jgi:hypothetical protein
MRRPVARRVTAEQWLRAAQPDRAPKLPSGVLFTRPVVSCTKIP